MYAHKNTASDTYITYSNYITKLIFITLNKFNCVTYLNILIDRNFQILVWCTYVCQPVDILVTLSYPI